MKKTKINIDKNGIFEIDKHGKKWKKREKTQIKRNNTIVGDGIEVMIEKLKEGEGEDAIEERDLVYNDNETSTVNPITNIRSDKFDLMLEETMGKYEHDHKKGPNQPTDEGQGEDQNNTEE